VRLLLILFLGKGLVYARGNNPTKFILERVDSERQDVFMYVPLTNEYHHVFTIDTIFSVKPVNEDGSESSLIGWQLPSGEDGTQVGPHASSDFFLPPPTIRIQIRVSNVMIEGGEWRFTERTLAEE
jgi:hypothetical protein